MGFGLAARIDEQDFDVAAQFPQNLSAGATGRRECIGIRRDGEPAEGACALGNRLEDRYALGAERQAVTSVLDIAAGVEAAGRVFERSSDTEMRIRRVRIFARRERRFEQSIRHERVCRLG